MLNKLQFRRFQKMSSKKATLKLYEIIRFGCKIIASLVLYSLHKCIY